MSLIAPPGTRSARWVDPGAWAMHSGAGELVTLLGSCVTLAAWHPRFRTGGMCHCIHPRLQPRSAGTPRHPAYAPDGFEVLRDAFAGSGMHLADCRILVAGGANTVIVRPGEETIGERNIRWLKHWLASQDLVPDREALGGACSRRVIIDCQSGAMSVMETPIDGVPPARVFHG
jgi:chemotaxis protein CheD